MSQGKAAVGKAPNKARRWFERKADVPLKIDFKSGEKMMINGAVVENGGPNAKIVVHNQATILREKEVLPIEESATPASRVYFALQCAYMFTDKQDEYLELVEKYLSEYIEACPSATPIAEKIRGEIASENYYKGLKAVQDLIDHEQNTLASFNLEMEKLSAAGHDE